MCIVKKPKAVAVNQPEKEAPVLRNPYLDGIDPVIRSRMTGLKSLRIDAVPRAKAANPALTVSPASGATTTTSPTVSDSERALLGLVVGNKFAAGL